MKAANLLCKRLSTAGAVDGMAPLGAAASGGGSQVAHATAFGGSVEIASGDVAGPRLPWDLPAAAGEHSRRSRGATDAGAEDGYGHGRRRRCRSADRGRDCGRRRHSGGRRFVAARTGARRGPHIVPPNASGPPGGGDDLALGNSTFGTAGHPSATPGGCPGSTLFRVSDT